MHRILAAAALIALTGPAHASDVCDTLGDLGSLMVEAHQSGTLTERQAVAMLSASDMPVSVKPLVKTIVSNGFDWEGEPDVYGAFVRATCEDAVGDAL
ncbi:hypothetical protein DRW48_10340 [Paracoccus suum]|uniref:DUF732 domain-containing protein n=1 Tax=Paracoccus suum TaxID=2259340 RepID=A0A344PKY1_9RHOB|nr:hypothetical protein [Paracoccus suum]AXC50036.1 hypothetical protein DRW48_10340 [Paracoccus suum]